MKRINYNQEQIEIIIEKKKLFGGVKEEVISIQLNEIAKVTKELIGGSVVGLTIFFINGNEEHIDMSDVENAITDELFNFLQENKSNYIYKIAIFNVDTLEEEII